MFYRVSQRLSDVKSAFLGADPLPQESRPYGMSETGVVLEVEPQLIGICGRRGW